MSKILVTGAAGQLGQAVIRHLLETYRVPVGDIVTASRDVSRLSALAEKGVEVRRADFDDPASLDTAFSGVTTLLVISTDALTVPGLRLRQHKAAVEAAAKAGIRHIAYTSMPNPAKSLVSFAPDHLGTETAIKASGLPYTILRNAWYFDNHLHGMPQNLKSGQWFTARGNGRFADISREDCASAAAAALLKPAENRIYTLTGAETSTADGLASLITEVTGKPLAVVQVTPEQLKQAIAATGLPEIIAGMIASADANIAAGNFDILTRDFKTLTGATPQSAADFFRAHKPALLG
ncbi:MULTISPECIES: SDR family oxidoreductase [unclassified Rhizobium]|uniref:SDR family oxidoreductase n=1 Tax=unclassified Rhizobium TaxID=2613769 RepID=UPI00247AC7D0|nr:MULTISPECIES: SDR family oxidoreductase [unclassified Rhizobium]MDH7801332.1 NAD(P)H dehydrogenase (quinone) [Rhizobium sp. AN70]